MEGPSFPELTTPEHIRDLRWEMLAVFPWFVPLAAWLWYYLVTQRDLAYGFLPFVVLGGSSFVALRLRRQRPYVAAWITITSMVVLQALIVRDQLLVMSASFGVLIIMTTHALLGSWPALGLVFISWLVAVAPGQGTLSLAIRQEGAWEIMALYILVWVVSWLAENPMRTAVEWSLRGWARARKAVDELQRRRGELYRTLRALEEATYRIERMNQELILARREAELARAAKARFVATVSHELRSSLNLILGFSRLMVLSPENYDEPLPPDYAADVEAIYRNAEHLVHLVDDVLDLSRIEFDRLPLVKDRINLNLDVVQRAVDTVRPLAERKGLYLRTELADDLPWLLADEVRLRQVLLNFLNNAVRLTEHGGVTVRTGRQDSEVVFSVEDTGPGIPAEDIPQLFQEFHPLSEGQTSAGGGTGLGLSISKQLIELHGGRVWVESVLGKGSTFYAALPLPGTEPLAPQLFSSREVEWHKQLEDVCLVLHENPEIVRLLSRYVESYKVVGITEDDAVPRLVAQLHPRAVLTTPEHAASLAEKLQRAEFSVPLISCPVLNTSAERLQGVHAYLLKPVFPEVLEALMHQMEQEGETRVLIVDDDPDSVRLLESTLTLLPHPYKIFKAYDGRQALEIMMQQAKPDVLFLDLVMPDMDGTQVLQQMRADERLAQIPVVVVSAKDWSEEGIKFSPPISIQGGQPMDVTRWAKCLRAILEAVTPRYLPEPARA